MSHTIVSIIWHNFEDRDIVDSTMTQAVVSLLMAQLWRQHYCRLCHDLGWVNYVTIMKATLVEYAMVQAVVSLLMAQLWRQHYCRLCHDSGWVNYGTIMKATIVEYAMVQAVVGSLMAQLRRQYCCSPCHGSGCYRLAAQPRNHDRFNVSALGICGGQSDTETALSLSILILFIH